MDQNVDISGDDQIQNPQYPDVQENQLTNDEFEAYTIANDANMNYLQFKLDNLQQDFQKKFEQKQEDFLNQMRNFMQNFHDGPPIPPPGEDKEHEATKDTELSSTEDIQPLPVQEPPQNSNIRQLIREECCVEVPEKQKIGKGFSGVETPLFATMLVQPQLEAAEEEDDVEMETCTTLSKKVTQLEQDKVAQTLEIFKLKKRVKKLEKKRRSKSYGLKRLRKVEIDADKDITLVDAKTQVDLSAELYGRTDDVSDAKEVNAVEPTVFDDEEMAKRLHDEEVEQAAAKEKQEQDDLENAKVLQKQYENKHKNIDWDTVAEQIQEKHLDNIRKYQSPKRKPIFIAQTKKNMIIYLKNMAGYKMEHFRGMTYDKERFKKLKAVEVSGSHSTQDTPTHDPKEMSKEDVENMLEIVPVSKFKVEALQVKHDIFMLTEKDYPLSDAVMILTLSAKLQVDEDCEMARDLVMKIFMEANKPKSRRINAAGLSLTATGSRLMLLSKADTAAEETEGITLSCLCC
uniref:Uncharacterized protein n=1 Tax=Tanacetum cinerariifolium TaxID=118510 RepID=A0A699HQ84_TANCI|nr:hypothetical protein [Tanacetum cinerariifolium]